MAAISGGQKLRERLREMADAIGQGEPKVKVGFLAGATYPDGTPVAMIAAIQDGGSGRIPPRPFFRNMIAKKSPGWGKGIATQLKETDYDVALTLDRTGEAIAGQLRQSIVETNSPPLAASTLAKRGYTGKAYNPKDPSTYGAKPLVHTGHMLNSVDHEVVE